MAPVRQCRRERLYWQSMEVPLFPLNTVLFPGGPLPLRIFESRYLDMISNCLKSDVPFGVLLIREGGEVGPATTYDVGTLARIVDWYQGSDGLLGITAVGTQRFRLLSAERQQDGLAVGTIELLPDVETMPLPSEFRALPDILASIIDDLGRLYEDLERRYDDAAWVAYRFAEILPVDMARKQSCLESDDVLHSLQFVDHVLHT